MFAHQTSMEEGQSQSEATRGMGSSVSGGDGDRYDVFLSFRGSDTRTGFTDYLYRSLINVGALPISVFKDDESLPIGEEFSLQLFDAITRSKISIPIISENYASSKWCLHELVHIMDRKKSTSHIVLPIFYKVDTSDVRYLTGNFGRVFHSRKERFDVNDIKKGQQALMEVSYLNGWESEKFANGHEGELVEKVVETVLRELRTDFQLDVTEHLVGIGDHMKTIWDWAHTSTNDARVIGIYGMGGIGKTTLAKVIYNKLSNDFKHHSFLQDIRERAARDGIHRVQDQLIKEIQPNQKEVLKVDDGINTIKFILKGKKVLILLDDIDHNHQLDALAREQNWFTSGSIIIITTRYKSVLDQSKLEVFQYDLKELNDEHSLPLFNRHAFRMGHSLSNFEGISHDIISTTGGLPLALQVIGSYLYGETDQKVWNDVLKQLKEQPHKDVQRTLKISYDALEKGEKEIFLDIACFFIGEKSKYMMYMWDGCGFYANKVIRELKQRCLIKIGDDGRFKMHDQLRDLGRSIVREGQSPENCTRLWDEEAHNVLQEKKGTERIQAICIKKYEDVSRDHDNQLNDIYQQYTNEQFKNLQSLRFLEFDKASLFGDFDTLFSELRWLRCYCPAHCKSFPAINLNLPKLVVLELWHGLFPAEPINDGDRWSLMMSAKQLKVLHVSYWTVDFTIDFSAFPELEILILSYSQVLGPIHGHPSIGTLKCLVSLNLCGCSGLWELPEEIGGLKELKELYLDESDIETFPTSIGSLRKLEILTASECISLREIPNSFGNLSSLQYLILHNCSSLREIPSSIGDLRNLLLLNMRNCRIEKFPHSIGKLKQLRQLSLAHCENTGIPLEISDLSSLQHLALSGFLKMRSETELPSGFTHLSLSSDGPSLPRLSSLIHLKVLSLSDYQLLQHIPEFPLRLQHLSLFRCPKVELLELGRLRYLVELSIEQFESIKRCDLSRLNHLERLSFIKCDNLDEIQALDDLESLEEIIIEGCRSIQRLIFPKCLKKLKATYCNNLVDIRSHGDMDSLKALDIDSCRSIQRLILPKSQSLEIFKAASCNKLVEIQGLDKAEFLEKLDISECVSIERLPDLLCFATLKELDICGCRRLRGVEILERFWSCRDIIIRDCESLEKLPNLSKFEYLRAFTIINSLLVTEIPGIGESRSLRRVTIERCPSLETLPDLSGCENLQSLKVAECEKLTRIQGLAKLDDLLLVIDKCDSLELPELHQGCIIKHNMMFYDTNGVLNKIYFQ